MKKSDRVKEDLVSHNEVPYIVHEGAMARMDRTIKRMWVCIILLIVLLVASNAGWLYHESQFAQVEETTTQTVKQDAEDGNNNFIGGDMNGEADSKDS